MKQYLTLLFASFILCACNTKKHEHAADTFYMPAEWEQQDAVWLGWEEDSQRGYNPAVIPS